MAFTQEKKQIVDIGEIGNASTGDILYDGGKKINDNFDAVYNAFGDQRLYAAGKGENTQMIFATGYYQKSSLIDLSSTSLGSCHDISTFNSLGGTSINLPKGKVGEAVYFINSDGSINQTRNVTVNTSSNDGFASGGSKVIISSPFVKIEFWCISVDATGKATWDYSVSSMFGQTQVPIERTYTLDTAEHLIPIANMSEYNTIKLLLSFVAETGMNVRRSSEVLVMVDSSTKKVYSTEYAVVQSGEPESGKIIDISFEINSNNAVCIKFKSYLNNSKLAIKSIDTQSVGIGLKP